MTTRTLPRVTIPYFDLELGIRLEEGDEFTVHGEAGQFTFIAHVVAPKGEWIDAIGGRGQRSEFRSFRPERIKKKRARRT